jgi:ferritin
MKLKYHSKRTDELLKLIEIKEDEIEKNISELLVSIKNGNDNKTVELLTTKRNSLIIDLRNLNKQLEFVGRGKCQYGNEFVEYSSKHIDIDYNY